MLLLSHISSHAIHLFFIFSFLYLNFSSPYFQKKKKNFFFFSLLVHTSTFTYLPTFPLLFCLFISPLLYCYTFLRFFIICPFFYFYTYCYTFSNIFLSFFLPLYLPTTLSLYFLSLFYNLPLLLPFLFCINLISFS